MGWMAGGAERRVLILAVGILGAAVVFRSA